MDLFIKIVLAGIITAVGSCADSTSQKSHQENHISMQKDTCEDPDADITCCFVHIPASISNVMKISDAAEPGESLIITGTILHADGITPFGDVIMYAYHTDNKGVYSKSGKEKGFHKWHGRLHGWCKTGSDGKYEIHTIRPASYPNSTAPAHIHAALRLPDASSVFYISDFIFADDPFVNKQAASNYSRNPGGTGIVNLEWLNGVWNGNRNIVVEQID